MNRPSTRSGWFLWLPLAVVAFIGGWFIYGLTAPKDNNVYSAMVGKKLPGFALPAATAGVIGLSNTDMADGKPRPDLFIEDKLHFNAEGNKLFAARVRKYLK